MKGITIKVDDKTHMKLKLACIKKGSNITQVMNDLINTWIRHIESENE